MEPGGAGRARDIAPTKPREDGGTKLRRAGNLPTRRPGEAPAWLLPLIAVAALAPACSAAPSPAVVSRRGTGRAEREGR
jgi:hypothetical protein